MEHGIDYPLPVVTSDDVRVIQRYVREGKNLPTTSDTVSKKFPAAPKNLLPEIVKNYSTINSHAASWESVEQAMIQVSAVLVAFSKDLCEYGDEAVEIVRDMEGYKSRKISSLSTEELNAFPSISLDGDDQAKISGLTQTVDYIKKSIVDKKQQSAATLKTLESFQKILIDTIEPWIGSMIRVSNPDALDSEISNIRTQIIKLKDSLTDAEKTKSEMFSGFGGFFSSLLDNLDGSKKRVELSTDIKELISRREVVLEKLTSDNKLKGFFQILYTSMGSLYDVVTPAINTINQLNSHWDTIIYLIDHSSDQFKNYTLLGIFVRKLETLLKNWRTIQNNSTALMNAFRLQ
jgi:hypothetical protein